MGQVNSTAKSNVASKWASKHLLGYLCLPINEWLFVLK